MPTHYAQVLCRHAVKQTGPSSIAIYVGPHERMITLVIWHQQRLVGDVSFHLKFAVKVTHPYLKNAYFDQYLQITSQL